MRCFVIILSAMVSSVQMKSVVSNETLSEEDGELRIFYGVDAKISELPYIVRLEKKMGGNTCTGSIIHADWVLSAGHCVSNLKIPDDLEVLAGLDTLDARDSAQARSGLKLVMHPGYDRYRFQMAKFDFSLVKVDKSFEIGGSVKILELDTSPWPQDTQMYERPCLAAGWGRQEDADAPFGNRAENLRKIEVLGMHGETACKCWRSYHNRRLVCLKTLGKGLCSGDSGGILTCGGKGVGVAHVGYMVDSCAPLALTYPHMHCGKWMSAYMYVCPQLDWIGSHVPGIPKTPSSCKGRSILHNNFNALVIVVVFVNVT